MSSINEYNFTLLTTLLKKIDEQDVKIGLILQYIIDKENLNAEEYKNNIVKNLIKTNLESWDEINTLLEETRKINQNPEDDEFLDYLKKLFDKDA